MAAKASSWSAGPQEMRMQRSMGATAGIRAKTPARSSPVSTARAKALAAGLSKRYDGGGRLMDGDKGAALMLLPGLIPDKFAK